MKKFAITQHAVLILQKIWKKGMILHLDLSIKLQKKFKVCVGLLPEIVCLVLFLLVETNKLSEFALAIAKSYEMN